MTTETALLREALEQAYTLLISAEPTLIRDAERPVNPVSDRLRGLLRDRVAEWLEPYRDHFDAGVAALAAIPVPEPPALAGYIVPETGRGVANGGNALPASVPEPREPGLHTQRIDYDDFTMRSEIKWRLAHPSAPAETKGTGE